MGKPRVTFVIPHWNRRYLLEKSIPSLLNQDYTSFRILVVDNGSQDDSMVWLNENYPSVDTLLLPENTGYAPAANIGLKAADSEYIAFYSNDVIADPSWLGNLVEVMDANPSLGFAGGKIIWSEDTKIIYAVGDHYGIDALPYNIGKDEEDIGQYEEPREVLAICTAASLFRKAALDEVGSYDEQYFAHGEDTDLCLRLRLADWRGAYVPPAVSYHIGSASSEPGSKDFIRRTNRNAIFTFIKDYPGGIMKRHLPELVSTFFLSLFLTDHPLSALLGRLDALKKLPALLRKRKEIQRNRTCSLHVLEQLMIFGGGIE